MTCANNRKCADVYGARAIDRKCVDAYGCANDESGRMFMVRANDESVLM